MASTDSRREALEELTLGLSVLRGELERAEPLMVKVGNRDLVLFSGMADRLRFANVEPPYLAGPPYLAYEYAVTPRSRCLPDRAAPRRRSTPTSPIWRWSRSVEPRTILRVTQPLRFTYWGRLRPRDAPAWHEEWPPGPRLPDAIRLAEGEDPGWPDLVVPLRITAPWYCGAEGGVLAPARLAAPAMPLVPMKASAGCRCSGERFGEGGAASGIGKPAALAKRTDRAVVPAGRQGRLPGSENDGDRDLLLRAPQHRGHSVNAGSGAGSPARDSRVSAASRERGAALVITLIFVTAMAAAAVAFLAGRRTDALTLRGQLQAVEAQAMLDAALQQTVVLLANRKPRQVVPAQLSWRFGEVAVQVRFERETGKIDLNAAEDRMLRALPLALGLDEDRAAALADAIQDWRDENQLKLELGAEDRDYRGASPVASGAADRPFANPAELRYLPSVDPAAWALLQPYVTIYSGAAAPDPGRLPARSARRSRSRVACRGRGKGYPRPRHAQPICKDPPVVGRRW